jgi:hypothetical protein
MFAIIAGEAAGWCLWLPQCRLEEGGKRRLRARQLGLRAQRELAVWETAAEAAMAAVLAAAAGLRAQSRWSETLAVTRMTGGIRMAATRCVARWF